jgi:hypothetical protein
MLSLHLQNKEYLSRLEEYEEEDFIPETLINPREDWEEYRWEDWELGDDE